MDWSEINLIWREGREPSEEVLAKVREDIRDSLHHLGKPSDLVFHCVWLTEAGPEGPQVVISGFKDRDDAFDAGYYENDSP